MIQSGKLSVITGGSNGNGEDDENDFKTVEIISPAQNGATDTGDLVHPRSAHACSVYKEIKAFSQARETIIVAGGLNNDGIPTDTTEVWDPLTGFWEEGRARLPKSLAGGTMTVLDFKPAFIGGEPLVKDVTANVAVLEEGTAFSQTEWVVDKDLELKQARAYHGMATVPATLFDHC